MSDQKDIAGIIDGCIEELNQQLPEEAKLVRSSTSILVGEGGTLDSLGLITLLVNVEQALAEKCGISVSLLDELMAEHAGEHPFHTVASLLEWVDRCGSHRKAG